MTTPLTNPVVADANGWTPQVFAAEGTVCDVQYFDASDVVVPSRNYVDVVALGADTGVFNRTLAGGTRLKFSDSGGVVLMEAGDPSPDNVGGTLKVQGWAGTQGDLLTANFASVNAGTTAGALKENSKKLPSVIATDATPFAAVATIDIALTNSPTGVTAWDIDVFDVTTSSNGTMTWIATFSYDNGATYKTGAADYYQVAMVFAGGLALTNPIGAAAATTSMYVAASILSSSVRRLHFSLHVRTPDSGTAYSSLESRTSGFILDAGTTYPSIYLSNGFGAGGYGRATHVRLTPSTGTTTGKYTVRPVRGSGEA